MRFSKIERRACEILVAAGRRRATVLDFRSELHDERIYSRTWSCIGYGWYLR
jgi:hypothetical protein